MSHCTKFTPAQQRSRDAAGRPAPIVVQRSDVTCALPVDRSSSATPSTGLAWVYPPPTTTPGPAVPKTFESHDWQSCTKATYTQPPPQLGGRTPTPSPYDTPAPGADPPLRDAVLLLKALETPTLGAKPSGGRSTPAGQEHGGGSALMQVRSSHSQDTFARYPQAAYLQAGVQGAQCKPVKTKSDVVITYPAATAHQYESMLERQFQRPEVVKDGSLSPAKAVALAKAKLGRTQFNLGTDPTVYDTVSDKPIDITRPCIKNKPIQAIPGNRFEVHSVADARPASVCHTNTAAGSAVPFEQTVLDGADLLTANTRRTTAAESMKTFDQARRPGMKPVGPSAVTLGTDIPSWCTTHQQQFPGIYLKGQ